jgi:hypothetical protein
LKSRKNAGTRRNSSGTKESPRPKGTATKLKRTNAKKDNIESSFKTKSNGTKIKLQSVSTK